MTALTTLRKYLVDASVESEQAAGVAGNSRLTASTGIVLTVLLLIEGFTVLDVRGYITLHTVIGLMLFGPIALKTATTSYRMARYYSGRDAYVRRGAPPLVLRLIGPFVVLSSLAVLGTGVALLVKHGESDLWLTWHQAAFIVWVSLTGVHFLAHLVEAVRGTRADLSRSAAPAVRGRTLRWFAVVAALAAGIAVAGIFTPSASSWQFHDFHHDGGFPPPP